MDITAGAPLPHRDGAGAGADWPVPWTPRDVAIGFVLVVVALFVPALLIGGVAYAIWGEHSRAYLVIAVSATALGSLLMLGVALRQSAVKYGAPLASLGLRPPEWSTAGWAFAGLAGALGAGFAYQAIVRGFGIDALDQGTCDQVPAELRDDRLVLWLVAAYAVVIAPPAEELFFRGFALPGIGRAYGAVAGIIGSGLLFGALHVMGNPELYKSMVPLSGAGIAFAFVYWRSRNLYSTIGAHMLFNLIGTIALFAQTSC